jgi:hypothetical protein
MEENRCYVQLSFYEKLSSSKSSDMSEVGIMFGCIRRDPEYVFTSLFIFLFPNWR